jgi:predicted CopG family antitoxin
MNCMLATLLGKKKKDSEFSEFIREASSGEKKKVLMDVLKRATEDQKKIMDKPVTAKTA